MGRPRGGKVSSSSDTSKLDPKSRTAIRTSTRERKELMKNYQEEESHSEESEREDKEDSEVVSDFEESISESISEGESSGSEYGVKKKKKGKVSPKKGGGGRGRVAKGRGKKTASVSPRGKGKAAAKSKSASPKGKGRPGRKPKAAASTPPPKTRPSRGQPNKRMKYRERSDSEEEDSPVLSESEPEEEIVDSESEPEEPEIDSASDGEKKVVGRKRKAPAAKSTPSKAAAATKNNVKGAKNGSRKAKLSEEEDESDFDEKDEEDGEKEKEKGSKTKAEKKSAPPPPAPASASSETNEDEASDEDQKDDAKKNDSTSSSSNNVDKNDSAPSTEAGKEDVEMKDVSKKEDNASAPAAAAVPEKNNKADDTKDEVKDGEKPGLKNPTETDFQSLNFVCDKKSPTGEAWNFKIACWNVGGIKSWVKKNGIKYLKKENPDVMCLQEVRSSEKTQPPEVKTIENYPHSYWAFAEQSGHHGVGLLSKTKPIEVHYGLPVKDDDSEEDKKFKTSVNKEGRLIVAEFDKFFLLNAYVPNSGRPIKELGTKPYPPKILNGERLHWDRLFREYIKELESKKPVVIAGDLNVAHEEIDLANPKTNSSTAGFTKEERESFSKLLEETKLVDTFRNLYPDGKAAYTFWSYMNNARANNVGWRLDYFLISEKLKDALVENTMRPKVLGSDHCPIVLFLAI